MSEERPEGQSGAHTPPGTAGAAAATAEDAGSAPLPGADPLDLLSCSPELDAVDTFELVAELTLSQKRGAGRPLGSGNRKNGELIKLLAARGHRDPMVTLSLIQTMDFGAACAMVGATKAKEKIAVLGLIKAAATDLMPYHHSKKPQQLELGDLPGSKRPLMVIGEMNVALVSADGVMSAGVPPTIEGEKANEINEASVRQMEAVPHEAE